VQIEQGKAYSVLAGSAKLFDRGNTAIGGGNIVPERRQNRGKIPPLLRIIVCYQYLVIHNSRQLGLIRQTFVAQFCCNRPCCSGRCLLTDILLHCC
jgi:hypothetical protein